MRKVFTGVVFDEGIEALERWGTRLQSVSSWLKYFTYDKPEPEAEKVARKVTVTIETEETPVIVVDEKDFDQSA